jgi:hypothetical protein
MRQCRQPFNVRNEINVQPQRPKRTAELEEKPLIRREQGN